MCPELSIITCCHNEERYLPECLKSLNLKEHPEWEVIVIDDASTDKSREILAFFKKKFDNLRVHELDYNVGLASGRNLAMMLAQGEYLAFLDADDYVDAGVLKEKIDLAKASKADIAVSGHSRLYDSGLSLLPLSAEEYAGPVAMCMYLMRAFASWGSWTGIYRREHLLRHHCLFAAGLLYEDVIFCLNAHYNAAKVITTQEPFYVYRCNNNSITRGKTDTVLHLMSSARLYFDMVTFIKSRPPHPMFQLAFDKALEILTMDHLPRMRKAMERNLHKNSPDVWSEFAFYMNSHDSDFSRAVLDMAGR